MFRPAKQTDVKFFRYALHTPYLMSPLDGGIEPCTRARGENALLNHRTHDPNQRYMMPRPDEDNDPDIQDLE